MNRETSHDDRSATVRNEALAWFFRLSDGDVSPGERARFEAWRNAAPEHGSAYDEIGRLWADLGPLKSAFAADAPQDAGRRPRRRPLRTWAGRIALGGLAAACAAFLIVATSGPPDSFLASHRTAPGEQARVPLPDGSVAHLNTDSAIDVAYADDRREIILRDGEALFTVRKDARRPFRVIARGGRSTALGTVFAVRSLDDTTQVTVAEGTVRVDSPASADSGGNAGRVVLKAAQQVSYRDGGSPGPVQRVDIAAATAWQAGTIVLDNAPFGTAIAEIDRYRPGRIVSLFDSSGLQHVTARLSIANLDGGLRALARTHGLSVTRITDYLLIVH
jgi:transmembrane sensor